MARKKGSTPKDPPELEVVEGGKTDEPEFTAEYADKQLVKLNAEYAYLTVPGLVAHKTEDARGIEQYVDVKPQAFKTAYSNTWIKPGGQRFTRLGQYWLEGWHGRRTYKDTVFAPDRKPGASVRGYLNTWTGFTVMPDKAGNCELLLDHLLKDIAHGDKEHYNKILAWMAKVVQQPRQRTGVALVLQGGSGTGKSTIAKALGGLLPQRSYCTFSSYDDITTTFNEDLEECILLSAEEAIFAADKRKQGHLYDLLTRDTLTIRPLYRRRKQVSSFVHMIVTSNHDWCAPARADDRRFMVFRCDMPNVSDPRAYFDELYDQLSEQGGYGKLLYILQQFDLDAVDLRDIPQTDARLLQQIESLESLEGYAYTIAKEGAWPLTDGEWPDGLGWPTSILYQDYLRWARAQGEKHAKSELSFGRLFRGKLAVRRRKIWDPEARQQTWHYQPGRLGEFRGKVAERVLHMPDYDWGSDEEDEGEGDGDDD